VNRLLNILLVEFLDQRGLDGGTSGGQLGRVDGGGVGRGSKDVGLLGENAAGELSDLGSVRSTTRENNLSFKVLS
jgi:hypothetical protein